MILLLDIFKGEQTFTINSLQMGYYRWQDGIYSEDKISQTAKIDPFSYCFHQIIYHLHLHFFSMDTHVFR